MNYPQLNLENEKGSKATIKTNMGTMQFQLFPNLAPKAVENFVSLAKNGYYDGVIFHRVIKDFMIQGGDPTGTGMGGQSKWEKPFEDEFSNQLFNLRGALSMANAGPNTNGSQFFIVQNAHLDDSMVKEMSAASYPDEIIEEYKKGGTPWLDHRHTVFGHLIDGWKVLDQIAAVKTLAGDKPEKDVVIELIEITE
ncbi:peptidylprolyl isomerase [Ligilactobacillus sp. LYQ135]